jgi:lambda family phage portal protein
MNWLNRYIIAPLSPRWAMQRESASRALKAFYEVGEASRMRKNRTDKGSANTQTKRSAEKLRIMARHMEENLDIASGALDVLVSNTVGRGIRPEPQVKNTDGSLAKGVNDQLLKLFEDWRFTPEVTQSHDYFECQRLAARSWFRDGEMLAQLLSGPVAQLDHGTKVPFSLELLEADFLPFDLNDDAKGIAQGIEVNAWRRPRAYWLYKSHPGDPTTTSADTKRVEANRVLHLKFVKRIHQLRGVTVFAPTLSRFDDIKEIDESERVAARVAAAMAAVVKKGNPDDYTPTDDDEDSRTMEFTPGMIFDDLRPGEDIVSINSNRPNNALIPFRDSQLRSAAAGLGASYSSLSKNYNGTYSAQRQELVEQYGHYGTLSSTFIHRFCEPVWDAFVDAAVMAGLVKFPAGVDQESRYDVTHAPPPMPWIDPVKEMTANELAEKRLYKSRSTIIRERGQNPTQVLQEIKRDQDEAAALGVQREDVPVPIAAPPPPDGE